MYNKNYRDMNDELISGIGFNVFACYVDDWFDYPSRWASVIDVQNAEINWKTTNHGFLKFFEKTDDQPIAWIDNMEDKTIRLENIKVKNICSKKEPRMVIISGVDKDTFDVVTVTFKQIKQEDETYKPKFDKMIIHKANTIKDVRFTSEEVKCVDILMPDVHNRVSSIVYSEDDNIW